jgi:anti-sigma factor RsiW
MAMSETTENFNEQSEIEMLLPWYVTGKLDSAGAARVEAFLASHPEMARQLALVTEERGEVIAANEATALPSMSGLDRLMASVDRERLMRSSALSYARVGWNAIKGFFSAPSPSAVRWAAAAALALLSIQGAVVGSLLVERRGGAYETAAGPRAAGALSALVSFADDATAAQISGLLAEFDAQIVEGPKPGGAYRVTFVLAPATAVAQSELLRRFEGRRDVVRMVLRTKE